MKKLSIMAVMIMMLIMGIVSCSNENLLTAEQNILTEEESLDCETTIIVSVNNGRSWTPALYRLTATNKATDEVINVPDSNTDHITYNFSKGTYLFELKAFDENHNLIYRGKTEVTLESNVAQCEIFALKNSGNITVDVSEYAESEVSYNKIYVTAERQSFDTQTVELNHFGERAEFTSMAAGDWLFNIYSVSGTTQTKLGSFTQTVIADLIRTVTAIYNKPTPSTSSTTTSSSTTSSTSSTSTTSSTTTTTTILFDGYRVHLYGDRWSAHSIYYYSGSNESNKVGAWPGVTMTKDDNSYYYDMTESWVKDGDTRVIFYSSDSDRHPADNQPGEIFPAGVREAWFNLNTKNWETSNPFSTDPVVTITPSGNVSFSGANQTVAITSKYCTNLKYTTDGSNPQTSSTATVINGGSATITVGNGLSVSQSVTVKVYGTDGSQTVTAEATYTKIDKPATPTRLGAYYTSSATSFSIWSPDSSNVTVTVKPVGGTAQTYT
ncbi:MAG: starch-binding protein, partial [Spirochaetales bacterium]|nr:starch-binding protein [Spirochaetales bacterium]